MPSGCSARKASTWAGRKRWWTEQWPFQSSSVDVFSVPSSSPPAVWRGFHTAMSSAP